YIEQAVQQLCQLSALDWLGVNYDHPEELGFAPDNLEVAVELKDGKKYAVNFGVPVPSKQSGTAMVTLDGDRWAFVMSPEIYQFVSFYLTIPTNVP
ncbi:MAG TPA: hypothetical protein VN516_04755, partial [Candidatus Baltobacteraceae bacterium]|nr:hypothetical protein [Candidatus Baltobacteraceae bacterium]